MNINNKLMIAILLSTSVGQLFSFGGPGSAGPSKKTVFIGKQVESGSSTTLPTASTTLTPQETASTLNFYSWLELDGSTPDSSLTANGVVTFSDGTSSASFTIGGEDNWYYTLDSTAVDSISIQLSNSSNVLTFKPKSASPFNYSIDTYGYIKATESSKLELEKATAYSSQEANLTVAEYTA